MILMTMSYNDDDESNNYVNNDYDDDDESNNDDESQAALIDVSPLACAHREGAPLVDFAMS